MKEVKKRRRRRYPKKHRDLLNQYRHLYDELLKKQGGTCALCPRKPSPKRRLDIDHHHATMKVRGLLCVVCNRALLDWMDKEWLIKASKYVDREVKLD